ncbi:MAG: septation ring formation regulator EzrA [Betaproteobacteria bacterium]|jgi:cell division protein FtsB|nr:septation ring formation regulator EzrA [Betaproteobacteria bacterium]NBP45591.1 septation ring formation regulator EzrA [Betaproteobacteria bacterium]
MTRRATIILALLLVVLQGQLWFGRGSFTEVWQLEQQLIEHRRQNEQTELVIARSRAELSDLTDGLEMIEERARAGLGMVKPNEIFVQINR